MPRNKMQSDPTKRKSPKPRDMRGDSARASSTMAPVADESTAPVLPDQSPDGVLRPGPGSEQTRVGVSPYANEPLVLRFGPSGSTYYVSRELIGSGPWSDLNDGEEFWLQDVSPETGHTLIHYLYTGTYQTLNSQAEGPSGAFKQALLAYMVAVTYGFPGLYVLAQDQIKENGSHLEIDVFLKTVKSVGFRIRRNGWFCDYFAANVKEAFVRDHTFFASETYFALLGNGPFYRYIMPCVTALFNTALTRALQKNAELVKLVKEGKAAQHAHQNDSGRVSQRRHEVEFPPMDYSAESPTSEAFEIEEPFSVGLMDEDFPHEEPELAEFDVYGDEDIISIGSTLVDNEPRNIYGSPITGSDGMAGSIGRQQRFPAVSPAEAMSRHEWASKSQCS